MIRSFLSLFRSPSGFGSAGIRHQHISGSVSVLGSGNAQYGVEFPETGISIKTFTNRFFLEIVVKIMDNVGETRGKVVSDEFSRDITVEGETLDSTGVMAFTQNTACALANDVDDFGSGIGTILMDEVTVTQQRAEWRSINMKLSSNPGLVL